MQHIDQRPKQVKQRSVTAQNKRWKKDGSVTLLNNRDRKTATKAADLRRVLADCSSHEQRQTANKP